MYEEESLTTSYLDTQAFRLFTVSVYEVIRDEPVSIGDIRRAMGVDKCNLRWLADALSDLVAARLIDECWGALPSRWVRSTRKPLEYGTGSRMGIKPMGPAPKDKPMWQSLRKGGI